MINDGPRPVAEATRTRVEAAIAEFGYRPNALARGLRTQHTGTIGLLVPDLSKPLFAELARTIEDAAASAGHRLVLGATRFDAAREAEQLQALVLRGRCADHRADEPRTARHRLRGLSRALPGQQQWLQDPPLPVGQVLAGSDRCAGQRGLRVDDPLRR
jgi:hypothetical protein